MLYILIENEIHRKINIRVLIRGLIIFVHLILLFIEINIVVLDQAIFFCELVIIF